jgi:multidrug efflux pump
MIGETTLAMLYVPLFFYIFDRLAERSAAKKEKSPPDKPIEYLGPNLDRDNV